MNIIQDGVIMVVSITAIIGLYIFLSGPFEDMMVSLDDVNMTASDAEVEDSNTMARLVFDMIFAAIALVPIFWFVVRMLSREPDWGFRR